MVISLIPASLAVATTGGESVPCPDGPDQIDLRRLEATVNPAAPERISARIAAIAPSATLAVDAKAKALQAAGEPVIGFGAGEPDFPTPAHIVEAAVEAAGDPRNHRYTPTAGLPELREAIAAKTLRDSGVEVAASQILVTNGGKHAVYNTLLTLVDEGDEVLLPAPYWTTYPEPVALAGGRTVVVPTTAAEGYRVSVEQLDAARTPRTKALVFVSPSNPTGAVYPPTEIEAIGRWAHEHGIWVITDEIYEHLVYGGREHASIVRLVPELAERCVILNGVAKTYAMTGWRVGWMIGPPDVIAAASNLQSHSTSNVANVCQRAALAAVAGDLTAVAEMRATFDRRRRTIWEMLADIDGVYCPEPEGAFYAFPDLSGVLGREIAGSVPTTTMELADLVLDEAKVAFVPGEAFGAPGCARFSFALGDDDLGEGIRRFADLLATAR
jgi:aspartate/methionine/tyrosine aminotransferase